MASPRTRVLLLAVVVVGIGVLVWMRQGPPRVTVETGAVARQVRFRSTVTASGEIVATRYADIGSDVMGRIVRLAVAEGDRVRAGQLLAQIDVPRLRLGQPAEVTIEAVPGKRLASRVIEIGAGGQLEQVTVRPACPIQFEDRPEGVAMDCESAPLLALVAPPGILATNVAAPAVARKFPETHDDLRPPLKWAGGKRWQVPHLLPLWVGHEDRRLVEPFCGGLAVAMGLRPTRALLNDVNPHLVNFYRQLRTGLKTGIRMLNDQAAYYRQRNRFNALLASGKNETAEAAALFYYLNRTGYNGLCRFNRGGGFNVPFGRYTKITYTRNFSAYTELFGGWEFNCDDFEQLALERTDFIYADPPYDVEFTSYSQGGFSWDDQIRTAEWLSRHAGPVVLSNQATDRIIALYKRFGFQMRLLEAPRMISCTGDRTPAREVLATRNL